jgi:hypothetical protein
LPRQLCIGRTLHTPTMHDLLSCSGLNDSGAIVHFENGNSYIKLRDDTVFPVHRRGKLFYLDYAAPVRPRYGLPRDGKIDVHFTRGCYGA